MNYYDRLLVQDTALTDDRQAVLDARYEQGFEAGLKGEIKLTKRQAGFYGSEFDSYAMGYRAGSALKN
jgi:hypothetical protein